MDLETKIAGLEAEVAELRLENQRLRESSGGGSAVVVLSSDTVDTVASKIHARWRRCEHVPGVPSWKKLSDDEFAAWRTTADTGTLDRFYRHAPGETEPDLTASADHDATDDGNPLRVHWVDIDQAFDTLPARWKGANRKQAQVEIDLRDAAAAKREFIELEAARVHDDWRRKRRASVSGEKSSANEANVDSTSSTTATATASASAKVSGQCWKHMTDEEHEAWKGELEAFGGAEGAASALQTHHRFATGSTAPEENVDLPSSGAASGDSSTVNAKGGGKHWCDIDLPYGFLPNKWKEANRVPAKASVDAQDAIAMAPQRAVDSPGQVKRLELIGSGATSKVYKGVDSKSGRFIAVKVMHFASKDVQRKGHLQRMKAEIDVLSQISQCPNVVRYLGACVDLPLCELEVFSEYCGGGSVQNILNEAKQLPESTAKHYASNALAGLAYLHQLSPPVIHGDIKAANVLVSAHGVCKLADFGASYRWSQRLDESGPDNDDEVGHEDHGREMVGTPYFMSPEVINGIDVGPPVDIWSFGGFVLHMVTGRPPYRCCKGLKTHFKLFSYIMRPDADNPLQAEYSAAASASRASTEAAALEAEAKGATPQTFTPPSPPLEDFLTQSFTRDFRDRPSARDLQDLPWIAADAWEPTDPPTRDTPGSPSAISEIESELKKLE
mmetsp:Transcript_19636/g.40346  ORF Transcript_19636/g.40346 Transcript_19636/m.40346 type:complete len:671 (-) Transcript_19636:152-2164(-)